jgi:hypothetical protein
MPVVMTVAELERFLAAEFQVFKPERSHHRRRMGWRLPGPAGLQ